MLAQARADAPVVVAAWLLLLCATTLLAAGSHYGDAIARGGLRQAVLEAPPADRATTVHTRGPLAEADGLDAIVRPELERALRTVGGEVNRVMRTGVFLPGPDDAPAAVPPGGIVRLATFQGIERHATLADGRWPEPGRDPVEVSVSAGAAARLHAEVGSTLSLEAERGGATITTVVVGVWQPAVDDAYWLGAPLDLEGAAAGSRVTEYGPLVVAPADLLAHGPPGTAELEWRALPDLGGLRADDLDATIGDLRAVPARMRTALPRDRQAQVSTALPEVLAATSRSIVVSRSGVLLLSLQFAVLAAYAVVLVAGVLVERRRPQVALLRSRGATPGHLVAMTIAEAVLLAGSAAVLAPLAAVGVVRLLGSLEPLSDAGIVADVPIGSTTVVVTAASAAVAVLALTLPTLTSVANLSGVRAALARQTGRTLPQRLGIDLALLILAGIALWQLRLYGAPLVRTARGALGVDPLLVAAPAIGLVAGAVLAIRLVPRLGEIAERLLVRRRDAVGPLGGRQLARRPLSYSRSALLLMLAVSLGTFALAQSATWSRSQDDQAAYRAAADARLVVDDHPSVGQIGQGTALRSLPGVEALAPVVRVRLDGQRAVRGGTLLAIDPEVAGSLVTLPPEARGSGVEAVLGELAAARPGLGGVTLDGDPRWISIVVDADLEADPAVTPPDVQLDPDHPGITFRVTIEDADGRLHQVDGGTAVMVGDAQRMDAALVPRGLSGAPAPAYPLRLVAVELRVSPGFLPAVGTIGLIEVATSEVEGGEWTPVPLDPGAAGWGWDRRSGTTALPATATPGAPGTITLRSGPQGPNGPIVPDFVGAGSAVFRLSALEVVDAVPAIAGAQFVEQTGLAVGDSVAVTALGRLLTIRLVGVTELFPPLDPEVPFVVADRQTFERSMLRTEGITYRTDEWWLDVEAGREAELLAALRAEPSIASEVIGRDELAIELASDPIGLGVVGALGLGTAAALVFAAIGFLVSAAASANERFGEFALLRALGLSARELSAWLSLENAFLLLVGLAAGSALGLVLAWVVLPVATLSETGAATVPPAVVVIPWADYAPMWLLAGILLVATVAVVVRTIRAVRISSVLRARDG